MNCSPLGPLFLGFSRSWLPFPSPRDLPDHAGIQPGSLRSPTLAGKVGDGQGGLACCDSWGRKESDTTERLN